MTSNSSFPRIEQRSRHDRLIVQVGQHLQSQGFEVIPTGYEAGGARYDPDLFVSGRDGFGFYLELKCPDAPNIAIELDAWSYYRALRDVHVIGMWADGRCAIVSIDCDRPQFWGAAEDDLIPAVAAEQLRALDVPVRFYERGAPSYTSNKPFVVFRPRWIYRSLEQALAAVLRQAGISGV